MKSEKGKITKCTKYNLQGTVMLLALNYVVLCPFVLCTYLHAPLFK